MVKGEYDIQGDGAPKTSAKDVSYKSCLCALLIFIALCIIIILGGLNWSSKPKSEAIRETEEVEVFEKERLIYDGTDKKTTQKPWTTTTRKWIPITSKISVPSTTTTTPLPTPGTKKPVISVPSTTTTTPLPTPGTKKPVISVPSTTTTTPLPTPGTKKPVISVTTTTTTTTPLSIPGTKKPVISVTTTTTTTTPLPIPGTKKPVISVTTTTTPKTQILGTKTPINHTITTVKPETGTTASTPKPPITKSPIIDGDATSKPQTNISETEHETAKKLKDLKEGVPTIVSILTSSSTQSTVDSVITPVVGGIPTTRKWQSTTKPFVHVFFKNDVNEATDYSTTADWSSTDDYSTSSAKDEDTTIKTIRKPWITKTKSEGATEEGNTSEGTTADYSTTEDWYSSTTDDWYSSTSEMISSTVEDEEAAIKTILKPWIARAKNGSTSDEESTTTDDSSSSDYASEAEDGETTTDFINSANVLRNLKAIAENRTEPHVVFITKTTGSSKGNKSESQIESTTVKNHVGNPVESTTKYANTTASQKIEAATTPNSKINDTTTRKSLPIPLDKTEPVCHTSGCKSAASRMLSLMNHSVDACEDFYEFSCGGMQADNADSDARSGVSRMLNDVNGKSPVFLQKFKKFYDTCVSHEEEFNYNERLEAVKIIINSVGTIDTTESLSNIDVTKLFAKLVLHGSMPLMDVGVNLDKHSSKYIWQLTLPQGRPASGEKEHWSALLETQRRCLDAERRRIYEPNLNLTEIHHQYLTCNKNYTTYLDSLERTLETLGYYSHFNESVAEKKIQAVRFSTDYNILRLLRERPSAAEISKTISERDYTVTKVVDLQKNYPLIKWQEFFGIISGRIVSDNDLVQVYFLSHLHYVFKELYSMSKWSLNNDLLGIFAQDLFANLIIPKYTHHRDEYCLDMSMHLFHDVTSYWYMKSLPDDEIIENEKRVDIIFKQMISNLTNALHSEDWLDDSSRISVVQKAQSLQVYFPDKRCKCLSDLTLSRKYDPVNLTDEYQHNLMVMKELRKISFYHLAGEYFDKEYTFCHFIFPFDKDPLSFYASYFIAIPFGLFKSVPKNLPDYVTTPRIAIHLAREIGRHFDPVGIYYKIVLSPTAAGMYNMSKDMTENTLSFATTRNNTSQMLTFIPSGFLSTNQRMAENTALRLLSDSYESLIAKHSKSLPWISTSYTKDEIFFIAVAQEYCQKTDTLEYMLKLLESDSLPASLRVENMMSNSKRFSTVFKCREGATLNNIVDRIQFPYFPKNEYEDTYEISS